MRNALYAAGFLLTAALFTAAVADDAIKEGKWSVTAVNTSTTVPQTVPPQTVTSNEISCITNTNPIPNNKIIQGCAAPQIKKNGNTIDYSMSCDKPSFKMTSSGHISYTGDAMEGTSKTTVTINADTIDTTTQITGKYLGPCN
jgi:hypothetical protein